MTRVSQGVGVLLLTDMFGGTPTNIASMFLEEGSVEVVTGVNLPMVKLASFSTEEPIAEVARKICEQGRQGIYFAGGLLTRRPNPSRLRVAERRLQVTGRLGLHARAAANLVRVAGRFQSSLTLYRLDGARSRCKSILSIFRLPPAVVPNCVSWLMALMRRSVRRRSVSFRAISMK